jgi:hypothetical protein
VRADPVTRLGERHWTTADPDARRLLLTHDEHDDLWQVVVVEDGAEHVAADLRDALAEAAESDVDEPWIVTIAEELEHQLIELEGGADGRR